MSNENEISFVGDLYETVNGYSLKVGEFSKNIEEGTYSISDGLKELEGKWKGDIYSSFAKKIQGILSNIKIELDRAEELKKELAETAKELNEALEILKSAGDN